MAETIEPNEHQRGVEEVSRSLTSLSLILSGHSVGNKIDEE